jgi:hypothetical protein
MTFLNRLFRFRLLSEDQNADADEAEESHCEHRQFIKRTLRSTNYGDDPPGGGYRMTLQEVRLLGPSDNSRP